MKDLKDREMCVHMLVALFGVFVTCGELFNPLAFSESDAIYFQSSSEEGLREIFFLSHPRMIPGHKNYPENISPLPRHVWVTSS